MGLLPTPVRTQAAASATVTSQSQHHESTPTHKSEASGLVKVVRESTERFRDVRVAEAEGYHLLFGCVSGSDEGAMGLHYANLSFVGDGELDPARSEIVIYEPMADGRLRLVGADFLFLRMRGMRSIRRPRRRRSWDSSYSVREPQAFRAPGVLRSMSVPGRTTPRACW